MVVGRINGSPRLVTGNSSGKPPAAMTPRFTCSASSRRCRLHGVSSDQVLQMPMIGRPSNISEPKPWARIQLRGIKPYFPGVANHSALRNVRLGLVIVVSL